MQLMLTVMRKGIDNLCRTLSATSTSKANSIAEAFETFETSNEDESEQESAGTQDHESLGELPAKKRCEQQSENYNEEKSGKFLDFGALNEKKSEILNSLKQDLLNEETSAEVDSELASIINSTLKDGLPYLKTS